MLFQIEQIFCRVKSVWIQFPTEHQIFKYFFLQFHLNGIAKKQIHKLPFSNIFNARSHISICMGYGSFTPWSENFYDDMDILRARVCFFYLNEITYYLEMQTCQSIYHRRSKLIRQRSDSQLSCYRYSVHYLGTKNVYFRWAGLQYLQHRKQMCTHYNIDLNYTVTIYTRHRKFFLIGGIQ